MSVFTVHSAVGRCKGKTDICQFFFSFFFYEPFPYNDELILRSVAAEAVIRSS